MKSFSVSVIILLLPVFLFAQKSEDGIPLYRFSVSIEHSFVPGIFTGDQYFPDNVEVAMRLAGRGYAQTPGAKWYAQAGSQVFISNPNYHPQGYLHDYSFYAGTSLKLRLFEHAYLASQWNLVYARFPNQDEISYSGNTEKNAWSLTSGPTLGFEYFLGKRVSFRVDIAGLGYGFYRGEFWEGRRFEFYRFLGLGVRYNFDIWKPMEVGVHFD